MLGGGGKGVGISKEELQARLYAQSDVLSPNKPGSLKVVKRPRLGQGRQSPHKHNVEPLPALSAYQKRKNREILKSPPRKTKEEEQQTVRRKEALLDPISQTPSLPTLPAALMEQQRSLSSRRAQHFHIQSSNSRSKSRSSVKVNQSTLFLSTDPEMVVTKYSPPLESLVKPQDFIERLRREPKLGFLYLTPIKDPHSTHYNPYNLRCICLHSTIRILYFECYMYMYFIII